MSDPRFSEWQLNEKSTKTEILEHLDCAHERQARRDACRFLENFHYFCKYYTKARLLRVHSRYHGEINKLEGLKKT